MMLIEKVLIKIPSYQRHVLSICHGTRTQFGLHRLHSYCSKFVDRTCLIKSPNLNYHKLRNRDFLSHQNYVNACNCQCSECRFPINKRKVAAFPANTLRTSHSAGSLFCNATSSSLWSRQAPTVPFSPLLCQSLHTTESSQKKSTKRKVKEPIVFQSKLNRPEIVEIWKNMTVSELATALKKDMGTMFEILSFDRNASFYRSASSKITNLAVITNAAKVAGKRVVMKKHDVKTSIKEKDKDVYKRPPAAASALVPRPPVITIMGHVDHGKTTLLDTLRNSSIVDAEFGGITQHIGAFQFNLPNGSSVCVLDTPGHAAFSSMRGRGANVTDIAVLVVAADDGVMQQTEECIQHARNAGVPMVVAINKIDKFDADVARTRLSLLQAGVQLESQGGEVQCVEISAKVGTNLSALVEAILTQAEILELKADPKGPVEAAIIEANTDPIKGKTATCLVERGTLRPGAVLVAGVAWARVRAMYNEHGAEMKQAPPATPVQVTGWRELPNAGDLVLEVSSQRHAKEVVEFRQQKLDEIKMMQDKEVIESKKQQHNQVYQAQLAEKRQAGIRYKGRVNRTGVRPKEVVEEITGPNVQFVLKCDVQGSYEAIMQVLETYDSAHVELSVIASGVGNVSSSDVTLAHSFGGSVFTFNVDVDAGARQLANELGVTIVANNIIYRLVEQIRARISEKMPTLAQEEVLGEAEVQEEFMVTDERKRKVPVAGCRCVKGSLKKKQSFRVLRDGQLIHEGPLSSMRHNKSEAETIANDKECGIKFEDSSVRFQKGDKIVCFVVHQLPQDCDWRPPGF